MLTDAKSLRSDLRLIGRAIREGWKIPPQILEVLPAQVVKIFVSGDTGTREKLRAAEVLMKMHAQNVEFDQIPTPPEKEQPLSEIEVTEQNIELVKEIAAQRLARLSDNAG